MGIDVETFYDQDKIAILPVGFCYPGRGKSGDKPPRKECAPSGGKDLFITYRRFVLPSSLGNTPWLGICGKLNEVT